MPQSMGALVLAGLAVAVAPALATTVVGAGPDTGVEAAIVKAVQARMGPGVTIEVRDLVVRGDLSGAAAILAFPDPSIRTGVRARVTLKGLRGRGQGVRIGQAECLIRVRASHHVAVDAIARGESLAGDRVERRDDWLDGLLLKPLPQDLELARATRDLAPGDVIRAQDVVLPPPVRSGEHVRVQVRMGHIRVSADGVATQDGSLGEEIRVVNPSSGKVLRGRVVGPREVEVNHGT